MLLKDIYHYYLIKRSGLFDAQYFLLANPDVRQSDIDPLWHFIRVGWKEGRNPSQEFVTQYYLNKHDDVMFQHVNPLVHYILYGQKENRAIFGNPEPFNRPLIFDIPNLININSIQLTHQINGTIAIHLHIFYIDLIEEFVNYLNNMTFRYDLFISVVEESAQNICRKKLAQLSLVNKLTIKIVPNRGRDLSPFFCVFDEQLIHYDYIAHIHTKKSIYNKGATEGWREYLCKALFGNQAQIKRIFTLLQDDRYGLVYPQTYHLVPYFAHTWLSNEVLGRKWCARLGIQNIPLGYFDFPVGSMFWARGEALAPLFRAGITIEDFPQESGQADGTMAHCVVRLIGLCGSSNKLKHGIIMDLKNPSWSAWRFDQYINRSYEDVKEFLNNHNIKVIGFDIFVTLFCRPLLNPESTKAILAHRIGGILGDQYLKHRPIAEIQARNIKGFDVGLDEIYEQLGNIVEISKDDLYQLRQLEEEIEIASLKPRNDVLRLFKDALASDKKVVLISDTFLPRETIEKTLHKYGIEGWCDLYISNDIGLRKDSGEIYNKLFKQYSIQPSEFLMVGDNERSDFQIPSDKGASFIHLLKPTELARGLPRFTKIINAIQHIDDINSELSLGLVVRECFSPIHYQGFDPLSFIQVTPYNIGYSLIGPLLTSFSQWLLQKAQEDDIDRLYFLSREGKIIKAVFDTWTDGVNDSPRSDYLVLSRRAISVGSISCFDDILNIARTTYFTNSVGKFLYTRYGIQLSKKRWEKLYNKCGIKSETEIEIKDGNIDQIYPLLRLLETDIFTIAENESPALMRYLIEKDMKQNNQQAVVDIGYGGTIQNFLIKTLSMRVNGYYLMTDERSNQISIHAGSEIKGCFGENISFNNTPLIYRYAFELEKLLSSNEPQIEFYYEDSDHFLREHFRNISPLEINSAKIRNEILMGAVDYAKDACHVRSSLLPEFTPSISVANSLMASFLTDQTAEEESLIRNIIIDDYYCGRDLVQ